MILKHDIRLATLADAARIGEMSRDLIEHGLGWRWTPNSIRRCIRDLVALSSLPALWIKADARQIAESIGMLAVSILDADSAYVFLHDPEFESLYHHQSSDERSLDAAELRKRYRPNTMYEIDDGIARLRASCVPIGREPGSGLMVLSRRSGFPTDTERTLLRVAANQAAAAIERWRSETKTIEQSRALQRLTVTETALYTFTDRLFRAGALNEIYEAGLDAIIDVMRCDRASILMFDGASAMRFVAWRGLSEDYRDAVDGHSPWKPEDNQAAPISINNVEMTADVTPELKAIVKREGIGALIFIPIFAGAKVMGIIRWGVVSSSHPRRSAGATGRNRWSVRRGGPDLRSAVAWVRAR